MPPPPLPPATHFMTSGYQLPYGPHSGERVMMANYPSSDYMLPRPTSQGLHQQSINPALQAQNAPYQTPYHMPQVSGQAGIPQPIPAVPQPPMRVSAIPQKAKQTKPKAKTGAKPAKVIKTKISKAKQRPQSSKHLTPSLRAAIITLKVTDPAKSFKEIGEILALPAGFGDDDGDEGDDADENEESTNAKDEQPAAANSSDGTELLNGASALSTPAQPGQESGNIADLSNPNGSTTEPTAGPVASSKSRNKDKNRRRPIPRNTVAGIFKRAADRAGTDSDLYKMLEQTGRQAGSGRPKKGTGKKDLARAAAAAEAAAPTKSLVGGATATNRTTQANTNVSSSNGQHATSGPATATQNHHDDSVWQGMDGVHMPLNVNGAMGDISMDGLDMDVGDEDNDDVGGGWETDTGEPDRDNGADLDVGRRNAS